MVLIRAMPAAAAAPGEELGGHGPEVGQRREDGHGRDGDDGDGGGRRTGEQRQRDAQSADEGRKGDVPGLDAALGGILRPEVQGECCRQVRDRGDQALLEHIELGAVDAFEARDDGGQEEAEGVQAVDEAEVDCGEHPDAAVAEDGADADVLVAGSGFLLFLLQRAGQPGLLFLRQPLGLRGGISQVEPGDDADDDGGDGDAEEHDTASRRVRRVRRCWMRRPASGAPITVVSGWAR